MVYYTAWRKQTRFRGIREIRVPWTRSASQRSMWRASC